MDNIEQVKRELTRRSQDRIKVYNPLSETYSTQWDGFIHSVPARGENIFPRYIAEKWMREVVTELINQEEQAETKKENDKRRKKGWLPMNPQEKEQFDSQLGFFTNNKELRIKFLKMVYRGITEEYGVDQSPTHAPEKKDLRPVDEQLLEQLDKSLGFERPDENEELDTEELKNELVESISE